MAFSVGGGEVVSIVVAATTKRCSEVDSAVRSPPFVEGLQGKQRFLAGAEGSKAKAMTIV